MTRQRRGGGAERVPQDAWRLVCLHLAHAPHAVFRLLMASRSMRALFHAATPEEGAQQRQWWKRFFDSVCAYQDRLRHSNFRKRLLAYERRGTLPHAQILRTVFAPRCEGCGARFGHRLLRPFALRVCGPCLRAGTVSNHALEQHYGLQMHTFLEAYIAQGGVLLPLDSFSDRLRALDALSDTGCDRRFLVREWGISPPSAVRYEDATTDTPPLRPPPPPLSTIRSVRRGALVYLWRADIERIVFARQKGRWAALLQAQAVRRRAAQFLSARFRRLRPLRTRNEREREALQVWREPHRFLQPALDWMPGMRHAGARLTSLYERLARTVTTAAGPGWFPPPTAVVAMSTMTHSRKRKQRPKGPAPEPSRPAQLRI